MHIHNAKEILRNVRQLFVSRPNMVLVSWTGIYNDNTHNYVRGDLLFLNIIKKEGDSIVLRRIRPALIRQGRTGGMEQLYAHGLVRITNGKRKGYVLPLEYIHPDEVYVPSGLCKTLEYKQSSEYFNISRKGDLDCLNHMSDICEDTIMYLQEGVDICNICPELYLVQRSGTPELNVRHNGNVVEHFLPLKLEGEDINTCARRNAHTYALSADIYNETTAYPLKFYTGRGVICAKLDSDNVILGQWYSCSSMNGEIPGMVFECEG